MVVGLAGIMSHCKALQEPWWGFLCGLWRPILPLHHQPGSTWWELDRNITVCYQPELEMLTCTVMPWTGCPLSCGNKLSVCNILHSAVTFVHKSAFFLYKYIHSSPQIDMERAFLYNLHAKGNFRQHYSEFLKLKSEKGPECFLKRRYQLDKYQFDFKL